MPNVDSRQVTRVEAAEQGFRLILEDSTAVLARRVVFATGLARQDHWPGPFIGLPSELASHSCEHSDLSAFRGRRVAVVGRGQSAIGSAALLNVAGADVELISRGDIRWFGSESKDDRAWTGRRYGMR